jgi:radical SAM PhpK family P-methyltransferase
MTDCLVIGFYDSDFATFVEMVKSMGTDSGAFKDLSLAYVDFNGKPHHSMQVLNHFHFEDTKGEPRHFHNADFIWPVVIYLCSYLAKRGYSFDYVNLPHLEKEKLKSKLLDGDIRTIVITTTLYVSVHPILELIQFIRQYNTKVRIVVGGPYVYNLPKMMTPLALQQLFKYMGADIYVISNEGEATLVNIIETLKNNGDLEKVDNLAYNKNGRYIMTGSSPESNPQEENLIDYSLFPKDDFNEFLTLRTAKSCPFSCSFCGFPQRAGKYKYLTVELVEQELNAIRDIGTISTLTFIDDTFNVPKERFRSLLNMMINNNYGFKWNSFYRSDHGDERTIELMARAGCEGVFLGVESGSDAQLQRMNKTSRRKDYMKAIPAFREVGVKTHANFVVGFPGETLDTYYETVDLIEQVRPDTFRGQLWYADPITPIWEKKEEYGIQGSAFSWSHKTMDSQAACDYVDELFLKIQGSVWLPQNGFEQWSIFYLQRKGMSYEQIVAFLKAFNDIKKEQMRNPDSQDIPEGFLERVRASCKFGKQDQNKIEQGGAAIQHVSNPFADHKGF